MIERTTKSIRLSSHKEAEQDYCQHRPLQNNFGPRIYPIRSHRCLVVLLGVPGPEPAELPVAMPPVLPVVELFTIAPEAAALSLAVTAVLMYPDGQ